MTEPTMADFYKYKEMLESFGIEYQIFQFPASSGREGNIIATQDNYEQYYHSVGFNTDGTFMMHWFGDNRIDALGEDDVTE